MATAAAAVYKPAGTATENIVFYGQNGGNTIVWYWANSDANHAVTAADMVGNVTLIGVQASALTAVDFHS